MRYWRPWVCCPCANCRLAAPAFKRDKENQRHFGATNRALAAGAVVFIVVLGALSYELASTIIGSLSSDSRTALITSIGGVNSPTGKSAGTSPTSATNPGTYLDCGYNMEMYLCTTTTLSTISATKTVTVTSGSPGATTTVSQCSTTATVTETYTPLPVTPSITVTTTTTSVSYGHTSTQTGCFAAYKTTTVTQTQILNP